MRLELRLEVSDGCERIADLVRTWSAVHPVRRSTSKVEVLLPRAVLVVRWDGSGVHLSLIGDDPRDVLAGREMVERRFIEVRDAGHGGGGSAWRETSGGPALALCAQNIV